jgi:1,4-alpha-glucan branching enzyme
MVEVARRWPDAQGLRRRALTQAARELLLAQASDWPFIMKTGTTTAYAVRRVSDHVNGFNYLYEALQRGEIHEPALAELEARDNLFPELDYRVYLR